MIQHKLFQYNLQISPLHQYIYQTYQAHKLEMGRQIQRWGGSFSEWQDNVQELRDFILVVID